jgi:hypothetical protein
VDKIGSGVISHATTMQGQRCVAQHGGTDAGNANVNGHCLDVQAVDGHNVAVEGHLTVGGGGVGFGRTGKDAEIEKGRTINAVVAAETEVKM